MLRPVTLRNERWLDGPRDQFNFLWHYLMGFALRRRPLRRGARMRGYLAAREFGRPGAYRVRTACLSQLSRIDEAKAAHAEFLRLGPDATVTSTTAQVPLKQPEDIKRYIDALKQAGLRDS